MADALKAQGNAAFSAGNYEEAIKHFTDAIALDPSNHVLYSNRSAAHASLQKYSAALKDAKKCVELKKDWAKGYSRLGAAHFGLEEWDQAIQAYEDGLRLDPNNQQMQTALSDTLSAKNRPPPGGLFGAEAMMKLAMDPRTRDLMEDAEFKGMLGAMNSNPGMMNMFMKDPRMMLALEVIFGVKLGSAEDFMKEEHHTNAAAAASGGSAAAAAASMAEELRSSSKENQPSNSNTAAAAAGSSKADAKSAAADVEMEEASEEAAAKKQAQAAKARGNELYKQRQFDEAIAAYNEAIQLYDKDISFLTNRAAVHYEKGDYETAIADCEEAVTRGRELRADFTLVAKALARKANALVKLGRLEEAVAAYNKSLMEHRTADTLKRLQEAEKALKEKKEQEYVDLEVSAEEKDKGNVAFKEARYPEAVTHYTEALKRGPPAVNPEAHKIYSNLAACYTKLGAYPEGVKAADKCIELAPTFAKGYSRKGTLQYFMKEYEKAIATYQQGLTHDPENQELKEGALRCMEAMENLLQGDVSEEELSQRREKAMADPEIQGILKDPVMQNVLQELQTDPRAAQKHLRHPDIHKKISKLVTAGIIQMK